MAIPSVSNINLAVHILLRPITPRGRGDSETVDDEIMYIRKI